MVLFHSQQLSPLNSEFIQDQKTEKASLFSDLQLKVTRLVSSVFRQLASYFMRLVACFYQNHKAIESVGVSLKVPELEMNDLKLLKRVTYKETASNDHQLQLDSTSSIIFNPKTKKYTYICPAPAITNLVISGGGAKGVIIPGVIKAFEDHKTDRGSFRDQLENIAGSSVGALNGCLVAAGMRADKIMEALGKIKFKSLLGIGMGPIHKDGKPMLDFLRTHASESIRENLKQIFEVADINLIDSKMVSRLLENSARQYDEIFLGKFDSIITELKKGNIDKICITFSMLHTLHELCPKVFKDLTVTATCCENGQTFYFNVKNTPNLDIAVASRASASLPTILTPVRLDRASLSPGYADILPEYSSLTFVDGGYFDNIPVSALHDKNVEITNRGEEGQNLKTLVLVYDQTGRKETTQSVFHDVKIKKHSLFKPKSLENQLKNMVVKVLGVVKSEEDYLVHKERGLEEVRQRYTQRSIPLLVSINGQDFEKATLFKDEYQKKGCVQGIEYLTIHQDELISRSFDDFEELLKYIPEGTKQKMAGEILKFNGKN